MVLGSKLSFEAHLKATISKTRKGGGLLKALSKYLPRSALCEIYKSYVRSQLNYGDVIYLNSSKTIDLLQQQFVFCLDGKG